MTETLLHRGPDDSGVLIDAEAGVALGHRRLGIIDLSPPARSRWRRRGRFVLSFNGEIYNSAELRPELEAAGRRFRGTSDTEVMLEAFAVWGVERDARRGSSACSRWRCGTGASARSTWSATASA